MWADLFIRTYAYAAVAAISGEPLHILALNFPANKLTALRTCTPLFSVCFLRSPPIDRLACHSFEGSQRLSRPPSTRDVLRFVYPPDGWHKFDQHSTGTRQARSRHGRFGHGRRDFGRTRRGYGRPWACLEALGHSGDADGHVAGKEAALSTHQAGAIGVVVSFWMKLCSMCCSDF